MGQRKKMISRQHVKSERANRRMTPAFHAAATHHTVVRPSRRNDAAKQLAGGLVRIRRWLIRIDQSHVGAKDRNEHGQRVGIVTDHGRNGAVLLIDSICKIGITFIGWIAARFKSIRGSHCHDRQRTDVGSTRLTLACQRVCDQCTHAVPDQDWGWELIAESLIDCVDDFVDGLRGRFGIPILSPGQDTSVKVRKQGHGTVGVSIGDRVPAGLGLSSGANQSGGPPSGVREPYQRRVFGLVRQVHCGFAEPL